MKGGCAIFKNILLDVLKSFKAFAYKIGNSSNRVKKAFFAFVAVLSIVASLSFTGARIAYRVDYSGRIIATVSSKKQFSEAIRLVISMVEGENIEQVLAEPKFNTALVFGENINNTVEVADSIINNTDCIVEAATLFVDGNAVACAERKTLDNAVNCRLNSFNIKDQENTSRFTDDVTIKSGYFMASDLDSTETVSNVVNSLGVITETRQVTDVIVPYKTTVTKTNERVVGYSEVSVAGVSGVNRLTQNIVMINGEVQSCVDVENEVLVAPVNEVIIKGTAKTLASANQKQAAHSAGFIFPLPNVEWRVSSYYGDGRGHKGVDICAKSGTSIFAVADGVVVSSKWDGNYGNCVVIEHENGLRTRYAHAKQLCCKVGDRVSQGEVIALVGTTGQSSGYHLHFEVTVNGKNVDPAPYINLD